jgi:hypothetical protein
MPDSTLPTPRGSDGAVLGVTSPRRYALMELDSEEVRVWRTAPRYANSGKLVARHRHTGRRISAGLVDWMIREGLAEIRVTASERDKLILTEKGRAAIRGERV